MSIDIIHRGGGCPQDGRALSGLTAWSARQMWGAHLRGSTLPGLGIDSPNQIRQPW